MGRIQLLDEQISNQIAAGEVVERPASVVKELVENSIDASSTRVDVSIEEGGLQSIRVRDNGSGIEAEDCELAFFRHATSKIARGKDLFSIRTLGFRGEALPSIAAVSKVTCTTATDNNGLGRQIVIEGGNICSVQETAASKGTDIIIKDLFYNTPARLKYMKTIQTELGHISDYMYRLALAHPDRSFTLRHNGNTLLQTLGNGDLLQVIAAIYGTNLAKKMISLKGESLDYTVRGYISKPELTRANRSGISIFVNGRYVRSFPLNHAILSGYHTLLPINRFPLVVLEVGMDLGLVDVNVHPAKLEVRFSKEQDLTRWLEELIKETLGMQVLIPKADKPAKIREQVVQEELHLARAKEETAPAFQGQTKFKEDKPSQSAPVDKEIFSTSVRYQAEDMHEKSRISESPLLESYADPNQFRGWESSPEAGNSPGAGSRSKPSGYHSDYGFNHGSGYRSDYRMPHGNKQPSVQSVKSLLPEPKEETGQGGGVAFPELTPVGQVHGTYLVAQNEEGLFLIDQHAAHERINYEYYYHKFGQPEEASQELLMPISLEFTPSEAAALKDRLHLLEQVGVHIEPFGGNTFLVRAYPHWFPSGDEKEIIDEMCEWILSEKQGVDLAKLREKSSTLCSCKASIKANQNLSRLEMEVLLDRLSGCKNPYTCPHGRPIVVSFSTYELEKMFKRVM